MLELAAFDLAKARFLAGLCHVTRRKAIVAQLQRTNKFESFFHSFLPEFLAAGQPIITVTRGTLQLGARASTVNTIRCKRQTTGGNYFSTSYRFFAIRLFGNLPKYRMAARSCSFFYK